MCTAHFFQFFQLFLARTLQLFQFSILRSQFLHQRIIIINKIISPSPYALLCMYPETVRYDAFFCKLAEQLLLILLIISMRYNSLRCQLNWHSKQQSHLFKKLNKPPNEIQKLPEETAHLEEQPKAQEFIWLEKMMKDLRLYKEESKDGTKKWNRQGESVDAILKDKCGSIGRTAKITQEKPQKLAVTLEESGKSSKKIKFEVVVQSEKAQSAMKIICSEPKSKPKSAKRTPSKTAIKKSLPQKQITSQKTRVSNRQVAICCPSNTKVIDVQQIKTDPYAFKEADLKILKELWKNQSEIGQKQANNNTILTSKKSVGKIIRNSDKLNKTCIQSAGPKAVPSAPSKDYTINQSNQNSSYKQYKQSRNKQSISINSFQSRELQPYNSKQIKIYESQQPIRITQPSLKDSTSLIIKDPINKVVPEKKKSKYQKIFIKLQTQKLSEYLCEKSEIKEQQKQKIIQTNEYQKYCQTNRVQPSTTSASINIGTQYQYKSVLGQKIKRQAEYIKRESITAPRAKSEQRKLNKSSQITKTNNLVENEHKRNEQKYNISKPQIKLKRRYDYTQDEPSKAQKLFTLHSVSSDQSEKQVKQVKQEQAVQIPIPQQITQEQQPSMNISNEASSIHVQNQSSCMFSQQPSSETVESRIRQSNYTSEEPCKDPTQYLTILFNFLDQGHRGLLTDNNCQYQPLTEQLKLLFSAILNQIRTKKKFYNLPKFIQESKEILQIKNQVYMNNHCKLPQDKNMVYESLRQNVDLLKKKHPLMFVRCAFTQSCSQSSNLHSKKSSFNYGQSVVIEKMQLPRKEEDIASKNCLQEKGSRNIVIPTLKNLGINDIKQEKSKKDKENAERSQETMRRFSRRSQDSHRELDLMQPEIYFQRKYGINKQEQDSKTSEKMSSILQKTRGYLQNLDTYLKMR